MTQPIDALKLYSTLVSVHPPSSHPIPGTQPSPHTPARTYITPPPSPRTSPNHSPTFVITTQPSHCTFLRANDPRHRPDLDLNSAHRQDNNTSGAQLPSHHKQPWPRVSCLLCICRNNSPALQFKLLDRGCICSQRFMCRHLTALPATTRSCAPLPNSISTPSSKNITTWIVANHLLQTLLWQSPPSFSSPAPSSSSSSPSSPA